MLRAPVNSSEGVDFIANSNVESYQSFATMATSKASRTDNFSETEIYNLLINMVKTYCVKEKKQTGCVVGSERYERSKDNHIMLKCAS